MQNTDAVFSTRLQFEEEHVPLPPRISPTSDLRFLTSNGARRDIESHVPIFRIAEIRRRATQARRRGGVVWRRFNGAGRRKIGHFESLKNVVVSSCE